MNLYSLCIFIFLFTLYKEMENLLKIWTRILKHLLKKMLLLQLPKLPKTKQKPIPRSKDRNH